MKRWVEIHNVYRIYIYIFCLILQYINIYQFTMQDTKRFQKSLKKLYIYIFFFFTFNFLSFISSTGRGFFCEFFFLLVFFLYLSCVFWSLVGSTTSQTSYVIFAMKICRILTFYCEINFLEK